MNLSKIFLGTKSEKKNLDLNPLLPQSLQKLVSPFPLSLTDCSPFPPALLYNQKILIDCIYQSFF